jgi:polyhydroxyalkanoate synthase subunit PhaC
MSDKQKPAFQLPDGKVVAESLSRITRSGRRLVQEYLARQARGEAAPPADAGAGVGKAFLELSQKMMTSPQRLIEIQATFWKDYLSLWERTSRRMMGEAVEPVIEPAPGDRRFKDEEWAKSAVFDFIKQSYLLTARSIQKAVGEAEGLDDTTAARVEFYTRQFVDAMSPSNSVALNPTVLKATLESGGENLIKGLANLLEDLERGKGDLRIRMTDTKAFELGRDVAVTPGKVVFQTELMQLLQYAPSTADHGGAFRRPILIVPPWINKYYVLDLSPKNSFIRWAVAQGFTVFVISWVNPDERLAEKGFEDYLREGPLAALDAIEQATGEHEVAAIGYCLGGTLLSTTLAYLAQKGDERITAATFFTTLTDFSEPGELGVFIDEEQVSTLDKQMSEKGYLDGAQMASAFSLIRANDLIWSFVVNNYLLGKDPMPFDILAWGSDATRMPRRMHSEYLRNMYLHNRLREPGGISLLGQPIDLGRVTVPAYFLSAREDYIAPWKTTYLGTSLLRGPARFVLSGSGHIAGVINPAGSKRYGYATNASTPPTADAWLAGSEPHEGSWWSDWLAWIAPTSGERVAARTPGSGALRVLEDAPGSYVRVRW